jgi:hypothetical protein
MNYVPYSLPKSFVGLKSDLRREKVNLHQPSLGELGTLSSSTNLSGGSTPSLRNDDSTASTNAWRSQLNALPAKPGIILC